MPWAGGVHVNAFAALHAWPMLQDVPLKTQNWNVYGPVPPLVFAVITAGPPATNGDMGETDTLGADREVGAVILAGYGAQAS